jgi:hypothetical protein
VAGEDPAAALLPRARVALAAHGPEVAELFGARALSPV